MRTVLIAAAVLVSAGTVQAAQRMVMQGPGTAAPVINGNPMPPRNGPAPMGVGPVAAGRQQNAIGHVGQTSGGRHWGGQYQDHWVGGMRAPGGWGGYRHPYRGYGLPGYWMAPGFQIGDWGDYGLYQPPVGYNWSRYYDDAVLIDNRGSVYDTIGGIDWRRYDLDEAQGGPAGRYLASADEHTASAGADYAYPRSGGYGGPQGVYTPPSGYPDRRGYNPEQRRSNGIGGALIGGAAGGIAGGLIAGRHDKVAGALIGAGAGALAGYAIDSASHRRRGYPQEGGPGATYPAPGADYVGPEYPPRADRYYRPTVIQSGGGTVLTTRTVGSTSGGDYVNRYYYAPATVTTVTVASAPVVTTTTEVFEDIVTYTRRPVHRVYRRRVWHKPVCYCR